MTKCVHIFDGNTKLYVYNLLCAYYDSINNWHNLKDPNTRETCTKISTKLKSWFGVDLDYTKVGVSHKISLAYVIQMS